MIQQVQSQYYSQCKHGYVAPSINAVSLSDNVPLCPTNDEEK